MDETAIRFVFLFLLCILDVCFVFIFFLDPTKSLPRPCIPFVFSVTMPCLGSCLPFHHQSFFLSFSMFSFFRPFIFLSFGICFTWNISKYTHLHKEGNWDWERNRQQNTDQNEEWYASVRQCEITTGQHLLTPYQSRINGLSQTEQKLLKQVLYKKNIYEGTERISWKFTTVYTCIGRFFFISCVKLRLSIWVISNLCFFQSIQSKEIERERLGWVAWWRYTSQIDK